MAKKFDKTYLGEGYEHSYDSVATGRNNNIVVVGASGSGKTVSIVNGRITNLENSNLIMNLPKTKNIPWMRAYLESLGYNVIVIDLANPESGYGYFYDPLKYLKTKMDIRDFAKLVIKAEGHMKDPFWDNAAENLFAVIMLHVKARNPDATILDVLDILNNLNVLSGFMSDYCTTSMDYEIDEMKDIDMYIYKKWDKFRSSASNVAKDIVSTCYEKVINFIPYDDVDVDAVKKCKIVDFETFAKEKTAIFLINRQTSPASTNLVTIFYAQAIKALMCLAEEKYNGTLPIPVEMIWDDFACGASLPSFAKDISLFREFGISAMLLLQSEAQLKMAYGAAAPVILDNCDTYVYTGGNDIETIQANAVRMQVDYNKIARLKPGEFYVKRRFDAPCRVRRVNVPDDPKYLKAIAMGNKTINP